MSRWGLRAPDCLGSGSSAGFLSPKLPGAMKSASVEDETAGRWKDGNFNKHEWLANFGLGDPVWGVSMVRTECPQVANLNFAGAFFAARA